MHDQRSARGERVCAYRQRDPTARVLILDWDVHHGNGTEKIFYDSKDVLYISIHRSLRCVACTALA